MAQEDIRGKDLPNIATAFADDDIIIVDGDNNGTRKMSKDTLLELTAQNALAGNVAPAFDPNSTTTVAGQLYVYNGSLYVAKVGGYQGPWDASKFTSISASNYFVKNQSVTINSESTIATWSGYPTGGYLVIGVRLATEFVGFATVTVTQASAPYRGVAVTDYFPEGYSGNIKVLWDGTNYIVRNSFSSQIQVHFLFVSSVFETTGNLPSSWNEANASVVGKYVSPCITPLPAYKGISQNACIAYKTTTTGGAIIVAYRRVFEGVGALGFAMITVTQGSSFPYVNISDYNNCGIACPIKVLVSGNDTAIVANNSSTEFCVFSASSVWEVSSGSFPSSWNSGSAVEAGNLIRCGKESLVFLKNGGMFNSGNSNKVCCNYAIDVRGAVGFKLRIKRPASSGSIYLVQYAGWTDPSVIGTSHSTSTGAAINTTGLPYARLYNAYAPFYFGRNDIAAIRFDLIQYNPSTSQADTLRQTDFTLNDVVLEPIYEYVDFTKSVPIRNGGLGNASNASKVSVAVGIDVRTAKKVRLVIDKYAGDGNYYSIGIGYTNDLTAIDDDISYNHSGHFEKIDVLKNGEWYDLSEISNPSVIAFEIQKRKISDGTSVAIREGDFVDGQLRIEVNYSNDVVNKNSHNVNVGQTKYLNAVTRYRKAGTSSKDFCAMIVTDSHSDWQSVKNASVCSDNFPQIDVLVHCGDTGDYIQRGTTSISQWSNIVSASTAPILFVNGNHEQGTYKNLRITPTKENLYSIFIAPIVSKGYLSAGTYTENKLYYYKDFDSRKVRLIVVDEFDAPQDIDAAKWAPVTYNSSYPNVANDTNYSAGDKVNVPGYTDFSFEAVESINSGTYYSGNQPSFKIRGGYRYITKTQAQWICATLASVPTGYSVMIATHQVFSPSCVKVAGKFTQTDWASEPGIQNVMGGDLLGKIVKNFISKTSETITISGVDEAAYLDDYSLNIDFTSYSGTIKNVCFICGHYHRDFVCKNDDNIYQIAATTSNTSSQGNYVSSDIERCPAEEFEAADSLTCVALRDDGNTGLCKIGNNLTYYGTFRDIEILKTL